MKVNNYKRRLKMNTVKKISTLFALALISQSSFACQQAPDTANAVQEAMETHRANLAGATHTMYSPTALQMDAGGNIRSAMQNTLQSASVANDTHLANEMQLANVYNSDLVNNMTSNANAMNSNTGSSYNDSRNTIHTTSTNSSTNTNTTNLDSSRNFI